MTERETSIELYSYSFMLDKECLCTLLSSMLRVRRPAALGTVFNLMCVEKFSQLRDMLTASAPYITAFSVLGAGGRCGLAGLAEGGGPEQQKYFPAVRIEHEDS